MGLHCLKKHVLSTNFHWQQKRGKNMQIFYNICNLLTTFQMSCIYHQVAILAYKILRFEINLKVVFRIKNRLSSKFSFKDKISKEMRSLLCYKFHCSSCNATYYGKTKRHFKVRVSANMGISACTGKNIKSPKILLCVIIC